MAYLKRRRIGKQTYIYIVKSVRRGGKIVKREMYLGNANAVNAERVKAALRLWPAKRGRR